MKQSKHSPKRTPFEIERDRTAIAKLYLKGQNQYDIARELNISRDMVQHDLMRIKEAWQQSTVFDFHEAKTKALAEIDNLMVTAWGAWEQSKKGRKKTVQSQTKKGTSKKNSEVTASVSNEETYGDPRFLQQVKDCISEKAKLLGLYPDDSKLSPALPEGAAAQASVVYLPAFEQPKPRPEIAAQN